MKDRVGIITLLKEIAAAPEERAPLRPGEVAVFEPISDPVTLALDNLLQMGAPGQAALRELHRTGAVRRKHGRVFLDYLAKHNYTRPR